MKHFGKPKSLANTMAINETFVSASTGICRVSLQLCTLLGVDVCRQMGRWVGSVLLCRGSRCAG